MKLLVGTLVSVAFACAQQNPTFAEVLKHEGITFPPLTIPHLNSRITSFASLNDGQEFLIAYYLDNPQNELRFPLFLTHFNKRSGKWHNVELTGLKVNIFAGTDHELPDACLGR